MPRAARVRGDVVGGSDPGHVAEPAAGVERAVAVGGQGIDPTGEVAVLEDGGARDPGAQVAGEDEVGSTAIPAPFANDPPI